MARKKVKRRQKNVYSRCVPNDMISPAIKILEKHGFEYRTRIPVTGKSTRDIPPHIFTILIVESHIGNETYFDTLFRHMGIPVFTRAQAIQYWANCTHDVRIRGLAGIHHIT